MSIERVFYCDWHECEGHAVGNEDCAPSSFITVNEEAGQASHFCSWDCLLRFAAEKPPTVTIGLSSGD